MKDAIQYYSVGALLYCPANREGAAESVINEKFGTKYSLAFCLEDTIADTCVEEAEQKLGLTIRDICQAAQRDSFYMPKIFIRVRSGEQALRLMRSFGAAKKLVTGFIFPKFSMENADAYIQAITVINGASSKPVYMMPIYESPSIIDLRYRYEILYGLKEKLDRVEELVLNIRVGGNDLCNIFGFRRHSDESIHRIAPIANIFSDIITVYGKDYVISGPVWEYYGGSGWDTGLMQELAEDRLCGFTGKTVIHPKQIPLVNAAYQVLQKDLDDARAILEWDAAASSLVSGSASRERMNEHKTHRNWAAQTLLMAEAFGVRSTKCESANGAAERLRTVTFGVKQQTEYVADTMKM